MAHNLHTQAQAARALRGWKGNTPGAINGQICTKNKQFRACYRLLFHLFRPLVTRRPAWILTCSAVPLFRLKTWGSQSFSGHDQTGPAWLPTTWRPTGQRSAGIQPII